MGKTPEDALETQMELRKMLGPVFDTGGLCGKEWLLEHGMDVTMEDIENQEMEVISSGHKTTINAKLRNKKDIHTILESAMEDSNLAQQNPSNSPADTVPSMESEKEKVNGRRKME